MQLSVSNEQIKAALEKHPWPDDFHMISIDYLRALFKAMGINLPSSSYSKNCARYFAKNKKYLNIMKRTLELATTGDPSRYACELCFYNHELIEWTKLLLLTTETGDPADTVVEYYELLDISTDFVLDVIATAETGDPANAWVELQKYEYIEDDKLFDTLKKIKIGSTAKALFKFMDINLIPITSNYNSDIRELFMSLNDPDKLYYAYSYVKSSLKDYADENMLWIKNIVENSTTLDAVRTAITMHRECGYPKEWCDSIIERYVAANTVVN